MILNRINQTISELCIEIGETSANLPDWRTMIEEDLLHEAILCIFGSQMVFEVALAAANRIKEQGILGRPDSDYRGSNYAEAVTESLSVPLLVEVNGRPRKVLPRFRNRFALLVTKTLSNLQGQRASLRRILFAARSVGHARQRLIRIVCGFGPKQASLFLRRVAYSNELAVLDTHILDYLRITRGIEVRPGQLSHLSAYEHIEEEFCQVAREFGYPVGCVDLAIWVTMRVAKRQALV